MIVALLLILGLVITADALLTHYFEEMDHVPITSMNYVCPPHKWAYNHLGDMVCDDCAYLPKENN